MPRVLAVAILAVLWFPSSSFAGTALVDRSRGEFNAVLIYAAAPGERNQVTVTFADAGGGTQVLRDAGASVQAGAGCTQIDEHTVGCAAASVVVDAGDGDDAVTLPPGPFAGTRVGIGGDGADSMSGGGSLYGGPGNDVLTGSDSAGCTIPRNDDCGETLVGGAGDDVLRGRGGGDGLIGDGANTPAGDRPGIPEAGRGNDVIDGGVGGDTVVYPGRSTGVRVDLADSAPGGSSGERDRITGVENAVGGDGADVLLGNDDGNSLHGGGGDDRLDGRGGNDRLTDIGPGADTLRGGAGKDRLYAPVEPTGCSVVPATTSCRRRWTSAGCSRGRWTAAVGQTSCMAGPRASCSPVASGCSPTRRTSARRCPRPRARGPVALCASTGDATART